MARGDVLDAGDFPLQIRRGPSGADAGNSPTLPLAEVERRHILRALEFHQWSLMQTAETLGIHRNTLRLKMREYGLERNQTM